ncbi:MAG: hypothetical protein ACR2J8_00700 [Thermomicrobiales bacterium]
MTQRQGSRLPDQRAHQMMSSHHYVCPDCGPRARFRYHDDTVVCTCGRPAVWISAPVKPGEPVIRARGRRISRR